MTIELAMYFALGFLTAGVLALALMTSLWRRAVRLTTRRVADVGDRRVGEDVLQERGFEGIGRGHVVTPLG